MPYYQAAGSHILHFGHGDIAVCMGRAKDSSTEVDDEIVFVVDQGTHPIGVYHHDVPGVLSDEVNAPVRLIFDNAESLDVVIDMLRTLRAGMNIPADGGAQAGHAWTDIAASAYRAYAASTGNKNFRGDPMPAFENLPVPIQTAWEAAARHTVNIATFPQREISADEEQHWAGWVRPQDKPEAV